MVDFVDLANGHRYLLERILNNDDDFSKMEDDYPSQQTASTNGYYDAPPQSQSAMDSTFVVGSTPVLSKSAEAELYLLATNFLLCTYCLMWTL